MCPFLAIFYEKYSWTRRGSNPGLSADSRVCYRYTTCPLDKRTSRQTYAYRTACVWRTLYRRTDKVNPHTIVPHTARHMRYFLTRSWPFVVIVPLWSPVTSERQPFLGRQFLFVRLLHLASMPSGITSSQEAIYVKQCLKHVNR